MDDPILFDNFLENVAGLTVNQARNEVLTFIPTFRDILNTNEDEINEFVKNTHSSNTGQAAASRILIPPGAVIMLLSLQFELKDRDICNALPDDAILGGLNAAQMTILRQQRSTAKMRENAASETNLPDMSVPKLTHNNYDEFHTAFSALVDRQKSVHGVPLGYIL